MRHGNGETQTEEKQMTTAQKIAQMQKPRTTAQIWQNSNGTWSHHKDSTRQWDDRNGCATDLRFHMEWERG